MRKPSKLVTSKNRSFCFLIFSLLRDVRDVKDKKNFCFFKVDSTTLTPKSTKIARKRKAKSDT